jgi:hypothetical protein
MTFLRRDETLFLLLWSSGYITISWQDHQVREVKPEGALRSIKKRYSNSKTFSADCNTMKQRIF